MNDAEESSTPQEAKKEEEVKLTEEQAVALMDILLARGYFHKDGPTTHPQAWNDPVSPAVEKSSCSLVIQNNQAQYVTLDHLQDKLMDFMQTSGSCTRIEAASQLDLDPDVFAARILTQLPRTDDLILLSDRIMSQKFVENTALKVKTQLDEQGCLTVSSLAHTFHWSTDECRRFLGQRLAENGVEERRNDTGMFVFCTKSYLEQLEISVQEILSQSQEIVNLSSMCQKMKWETSWVTDIVHHKIDELPGIIRGQDFIPTAYRKAQEQIAIDHYTTNGYVTTTICAAVDLLPNQLKAFLQSKFPDCIVLNDSIIDYSAVGVPLEALVQEANASFAELRPPPDLLNFASDVQDLVERHVFPNSNNAAGTLTVTLERVLFVSQFMMDDIQNNVLPLLVDPVITARAAEMEKKKNANHNIDVDEEEWEKHLIATDIVVESLMDKYPTLQVLPHDGDDNIVEKFVETNVLTEEWQGDCRQALQAEVTRLEATRAKQSGIISHTSTAEVAFEDPSCFAAACIVIQMQAKFLEYAEKIGMEEASRTILEKEVLEGCCKDLVRRLTLYLLDKYEVVDSVVTFETDGKGTELSSYCTPVDTTVRRYPVLTVKYPLDDDGKVRPLAEALIESIPIQAGTALAELGEASSVKEFLQVAEENCLTICGIPFRKIDKKSEKSFLAQRRQRLMDLLQASKDPRDVLELCIMLIYQSIKNQAVSGSLLPSAILEKLTLERKVSAPVGEALMSLSQSLDSSSIDHDLVERVRACGLAKDIAKHTVC